ncbi:hypothetical protein [Rhizobium sp. WYJ-E13]|uniref:hypothetical protein n=1 Tax=Rhizobium sp. WYJ-E13 TaxID=2849093 RepID=UPI001C1F0E5C|nr:hypothetical protein [Rhizobium sp. WYJ-E13]QWW72313.1 hypothetical protein KQ933_32595 [Rhizobium sp. WYJ-E13]
MPPRSSLLRLQAKAMLSRLFRLPSELSQVLKRLSVRRLFVWLFVAQHHDVKTVTAPTILLLTYLMRF